MSQGERIKALVRSADRNGRSVKFDFSYPPGATNSCAITMSGTSGFRVAAPSLDEALELAMEKIVLAPTTGPARCGLGIGAA